MEQGYQGDPSDILLFNRSIKERERENTEMMETVEDTTLFKAVRSKLFVKNYGRSWYHITEGKMVK